MPYAAFAESMRFIDNDCTSAFSKRPTTARSLNIGNAFQRAFGSVNFINREIVCDLGGNQSGNRRFSSPTLTGQPIGAATRQQVVLVGSRRNGGEFAESVIYTYVF